MRTLTVVKAGFESFDALHAYGLCIVLAETFGVEVARRDQGLVYQVQVPDTLDVAGKDVNLQSILSLPDAENLATANAIELANLDGLLTTSFTTPGIRLVSVDDAMDRQRLDQNTVKASVAKARRLVTRIQKASKSMGSISLAESLLEVYRTDHPLVPLIRPKAADELGATMPIDASLTFSARRAHRDGWLVDKTNVTVDKTPHASTLALVGAARCLRGQRVGGNLVNLYTPLFHKLCIRPGFSVPLLSNVDYGAQRAAVVQLLSHYVACGDDLSGLICQTLQTQGAKQSISLSRSVMSSSLLRTLDAAGLDPLLYHWLDYLTEPRKSSVLDQDLLCHALVTRSPAAWLDHLHDAACIAVSSELGNHWAYSIQEISVMADSELGDNNSLSAVIAREQGTLRFGRSLRSLGELRRADLQDTLDELNAARTRDQLLRALAIATQKCVLAKAVSNFVIVPNDNDLGLLLEDIDRWGVRDIAGLLIILSSLRYPSDPSIRVPNANVQSVNDFSI